MKERKMITMIKAWAGSVMVCLMIGCASSTTSDDSKAINPSAIELAITRMEKGLEYPLDSLNIPRSVEPSGEVRGVPSKKWVSGFYPGCLWLAYQYTKDEKFKQRAEQWTAFVEKEKWNNRTHDMGFKISCSFGQAYLTDAKESYTEVILQSAKTLITRFDENVGCIRSWDHGSWEFPVIIDNMMNLELLFQATKLSGDSTFYHIAVKHAKTTFDNHFRKDNSSYHVVNYDTLTGAIIAKQTHQGYADESAWARGQAWGLYGYTMVFRETGNEVFKQQAEKIAAYIMNHPNLPKDKIPYWDFNAPGIPNEPRDASAAAIIASGLYELSNYSQDSSAYMDFANMIIASLSSPQYMLEPESEIPFILKHSTGNKQKNDEVDVPIIYADYYYLEALLRKERL